MKILITCSGNIGHITSFVKEQADSLSELGVIIDYYLIKGKGVHGYIKNYPTLVKKINSFKPDLIHAHYGLSSAISREKFQ